MKYLVLLCFACFSTLSAVAEGKETLRILTWEEYFDPEMASLFETETGSQLEFIYYDNDEVRDQIMAESSGFGFDVILVDEVELPAYIRQQWVQPIAENTLPYLKDHGTTWRTIVPEAVGFAVPYGWGTYGLLYRDDLVENPPSKWADLFNPDNELAGYIQMTPQSAEMLAIALMAHGYAPNAHDPAALKVAEQALIAQKPLVKAYKTTDYDEDSNLLNKGIVKVTVCYSSDAVVLQEEFEHFQYVSPMEGNIFWIDFWAISAKSTQPDLAVQFLNFTMRPDVVAANVEYQYTATFSQTALTLIPDEIRQNKAVFPSLAEGFTTLGVPDRNSIRTMMKIINALELE